MNLTQRLRDYGTVDPDRYGHGDTGEKKAMRAAADEIERLTAERERDRAWGVLWRDRAAEYRAMAERTDVDGHIRIAADVVRRNPAPWEEPA